MKKDYTHISIVLDRSGSMESVKQPTIDGLNRFMEENRRVPGQCSISFVQFDEPPVGIESSRGEGLHRRHRRLSGPEP